MADVNRTMEIIVKLRDQASARLRTMIGTINESAQQLQTIGIGMAAVGGAITGAFAMAAKSAAEFGAIMKDVELQSGATAQQMQEIKKIALSPEFVKLGKSGADVAAMFRRLASEGYSVAQMKEMLKPITESAIVLNYDEAETTKLMLNLMQQYKLEAKDMAHISDVLANALANTSFQGDELAETMKYAGLSGATLGWSLEETVAATDAVIKRVGDASMAGTYFRQVVAGLLDPTEKMSTELARVGFTLDDVSAALKSPVELTKFLAEAQRRGANFATMFSVRAADAARALANTEVPALKELISVLGESGTAHEMATEKAKDAVGQWQQFTAALANLRASIGEATTTFAPLLGMLAAFINKLAELARTPVGRWIAHFVMLFGAWTLAAGGTLIALSKVVTIVYQLRTAMAALQTVRLATQLGNISTVGTSAASALAGIGLAAAPIMAVVAAASALVYVVERLASDVDKAAQQAEDAYEQAEAIDKRAKAQGLVKTVDVRGRVHYVRPGEMGTKPMAGQRVRTYAAPPRMAYWPAYQPFERTPIQLNLRLDSAQTREFVEKGAYRAIVNTARGVAY